MQIFEFLVAVVVIGTLASMFRSWLKHKENHSNAEPEQSSTRIDALEARIEVLERIVTDKAEKLKDDINNL